MKKIIVEIDSYRFSNKTNHIIITRGISTCIAFVVQGNYCEESEAKTLPCFGLYHWSGFPANFEGDCIAYVKEELLGFFQNMRDELSISDEEIIQLQSLSFIGGETKQFDNTGELTLSGTEKEVEALITALEKFNFAEVGINLKPNAIAHHHFITKDEQSLEVNVSHNKLETCYESIETGPEEDEACDHASSSFFL
ncbi:hypothetical protein [Legionella hackeliae]|uniref:Uncharacterized protein n=1 Tax=Legionella hackeliae TaxID=449 RepID=A0A0A8UT04_LEGHA|nr:hypothetical protein [Legionella hackeliae]KTD12579.1 hypothetical protein Lhac_1450 [Legionella hackeliae]CEK11995.1 protein of unknown function [Legionella hackeliae]STX48777.1 Uncharacterised protein [Legionella hackeliae]